MRSFLFKCRLNIVGTYLFLFALTGCSAIVQKQQIARTADSTTCKTDTAVSCKTIAIFMDGTHNDVESDTNVKRLHSLATLQNEPNLATLYIEGVGTDRDIAGMATGYGIGARVRLAYEFLLANYRRGDKIAIFGFSRGAYEARILTSMLFYIGLPDAPPTTAELRAALGQPENQQPQPLELVETIYMEMKKGFRYGDSPATINKIFQLPGPASFKKVEVHLLGLWDTVEALGKPDWMSRISHKLGLSPHEVIVDELNYYYGDQLLNVRHVLHAVSLDDNREWAFTPLLVTRCHLYVPKQFPANRKLFSDEASTLCPEGPGKGRTVDEVWFSGAHSDVGGGYADSDLSGVSLNWMISRVNALLPRLLPGNAAVRQDVFGTSHDPESGWARPLYHRMNRNVAGYMVHDSTQVERRDDRGRLQAPISEAVGRLCMHPSVFQRRQAMPVRPHENSYLSLKSDGIVCVERQDKDFARPPIYSQKHDSSLCKTGELELKILSWNDAEQRCVAKK